jgi:hypothetical protein
MREYMPANFFSKSMEQEEAFEWAKRGVIPEGFQDWSLADGGGWTVAHEAARRGTLTRSFDQWGLALKGGRTVAHVAAFRGCLPHNFDQWAMADENGWTVAHEAAENGHLYLPASSPVWDLCDKRGKTVESVSKAGRVVATPPWHDFKAAIGAGYSGGKVPADFSGWHTLIQGKAAAFWALEWGLLPAEFSAWEIVDEGGRTVAHAAAEKKSLPRQFDRWTLADENGWTVAHEAAKARVLPVAKYAVKPLWTLTDNSGQSVAHVCASYGVIPESFPEELWSMVDGEGWTVAARAWVCGGLPRELADRNDILGVITPEMESLAASWVLRKIAAPLPLLHGAKKKVVSHYVWICQGRCPSLDTTQVSTRNVEPGGRDYVYAGETLAKNAPAAKSVARAWALKDSYLGKFVPEEFMKKKEK